MRGVWLIIVAAMLCGCRGNAPSPTIAPAQTAPRVIRVEPSLAQRARDEADLSALLTSDVEDSAIGRGIFDYAKRLRILRLMEKVRKEYANEAQLMQ